MLLKSINPFSFPLLGLIRSVTVSPDSNWVAVAFSSGIVSVLDVRTGTLLGQRKGHDGDILQVNIKQIILDCGL